MIATSAADLFAGIVCRSNGYNDSELCDRDAEALSDAILGLEFGPFACLLAWHTDTYGHAFFSQYTVPNLVFVGLDVLGGFRALSLSFCVASQELTKSVNQLSDRYGRTRILVLGVTGGLIAHLCTILAYLFASTQAPDIYLLVLGGVVLQGGVGGKQQALFLLYIAEPFGRFSWDQRSHSGVPY